MKFKILFLVAFIIFSLQGFYNLDPDFGWHYRLGQIISTTGIPKTDPFSYSMPSFRFIDHEWLSNVLIYHLALIIKFPGLVFLFALISCLSLYLIFSTIKASRFGLWPAITLLWTITTLFPFHGVRTQVFSWLFLALFSRLFLSENSYLRYRLFCLPLIVLWANLHGSFPLGLIFIYSLIFGRIITHRADKIDIFLIPLAFIATFINPYGPRLWQEVISQVTDSQLKWRISEWNPSLVSFQLCFVCLACLITFAVIHYRRRFTLSTLIIYFFFLLAAISSQRHIPLWLMVFPFLSFPILQFVFTEIKKHPPAFNRFTIVAAYTFKLSLAVFILQLVIVFIPILSQKGGVQYPSKAVDFLKSQSYPGLIFSKYNWGGYLIKEMPQTKVFIDGRMPSWKNPQAPTNESSDAMKEYLDALSSPTSFQRLFQKYPIGIVLWTNDPPNAYDRFTQLILTLITKTNFQTQLESSGWRKVYADKVSIIYVKKSN